MINYRPGFRWTESRESELDSNNIQRTISFGRGNIMIKGRITAQGVTIIMEMIGRMGR